MSLLFNIVFCISIHSYKGQQSSDVSNELAIINLPIAAARGYAQRSLMSRRLAEESGDDVDMDSLLSSLGLSEEDMEFGGGDNGGGFDFGEEGEGDLLSGFGGGEDEDVLGGLGFDFGDDDPMMNAIMENTEKCGIDVADMSNKAFGAFLMSGGAGIDFDVPSLESPPLEMYRDLAMTYNPILLALKDDDEEECSSIDSAKVLLASEEYLQCSGEQQLSGYYPDLFLLKCSHHVFFSLYPSLV